jgi:DNA-binding MarR family transcriptional regulator
MLLTDWLEGRGLAVRRRRNGDGRAWGLYLTPKGRATLQRLRQRVVARDTEFSNRLNSREQMTLRQLLEKLSR